MVARGTTLILRIAGLGRPRQGFYVEAQLWAVVSYDTPLTMVLRATDSNIYRSSLTYIDVGRESRWRARNLYL